MGLKSHQYGVKSELKKRFPEAFKEFDSLVDARDAAGAEREETFICLDGNVLMMSVPQSANTLDSFTSIVFSNLKRAIATSLITVVAFDEPENITEAKSQEQTKRDAARANAKVACSADFALQNPQDDNYQRDFIVKSNNVQSLVSTRSTRLRFFDEVAVLVLEKLKSQIDRWEESGFKGGAVIFDGIDPRGGNRPLGEKRKPQMLGSSTRLEQVFKRSEDIGEGDLKLASLQQRARWLHKSLDPSFEKTKLCMCATIDTDSFAIELIEEAKRQTAPDDASEIHSILCMRERARKRNTDEFQAGFYLCCDISMLNSKLQTLMFGLHKCPTPCDQRAAVTLLVAGWSLCGCDFLVLPGMRADVVFDSIACLIRQVPTVVDDSKFAFSGSRVELQRVHDPIRKLAIACASRLEGMPRIRKENLQHVRQPEEIILQRCGWVMAYWNGLEYRGEMEDFGFFRPHAV